MTGGMTWASIATTRGDQGQTGLAGGIRVSKASFASNRTATSTS